jgi:hypothetical protein
MTKHKAANKDKEKGGQLVIRIPKSDRAAFIAVCEALDTTAAREIRRFMREFIAANAPPSDAANTPSAIESPAEPVAAAAVVEAPLALEAAPSPEIATVEADKPMKARKRVKS